MTFLRTGVISAVALTLASASPFAILSAVRGDDDDDRRRRGNQNRRDHDHDDNDDHRRGWSNRHHGSRYGHNDWRFVVPNRHNYGGAYFSIGKLHFYTPSPIVPARPGVTVQVQKPVELRFGGFQRHNDLGARLVNDANALCLDMYYNYRNNPGFAHVYREAYDILQAAKFVHAKEHQGDHNAIRDQAVKMDRLYHHIQEQVANWTPTGNRRVGNDDFFEKIANVEAIIHHLCWEVGVQPHQDERHQPAQPIDPNQPAPPPAG